MESWINDILEGVEKVPVLAGTPGSMVVFGERSQPIIANSKGQVLMSAAEYGQGRVIVFTHSSFTKLKLFTEPISDENIARFYQNIKQWVTRGTISDNPVIKDLMKVKNEIENEQILIGTGSALPSPAHFKMLQDYVYNGGAMVIGETPWGFLQVRPNYTLQTMPMNRYIGFLGMAFTGEYFSFGSLTDMADNNAKYSHLLNALRSSNDLENFKKHGAVIQKSLRHLPNEVFHTVKEELMENIKKHHGQIHTSPTPKKPLSKPEEKALVMLMVRAFKSFGSVHDMVKVPSCDVFPGDFDAPPALECIDFSLAAPELDIMCFHPTGWYVPPGEELTVTVLSEEPEEGEDHWMVAIGSHTDELFNTDAPWRRWPTTQVRKDLLNREDCSVPHDESELLEDEAVGETDQGQCLAQQAELQSPTVKLLTHAGGLVYFISQEKTKKPLTVLMENVLQAPYYNISNEDSRRNWCERKKSPGLWSDLVGRRIRFSVPSASVQRLENPEELLTFWDAVVECHYDLTGLLNERLRMEWVVADEQPRAGYMHAGYPVVTGLDVVRPEKGWTEDSILNVQRLRKEGDWGMFHELGHNVQDGMWTFDGTSEVTCNIFSLHAMDVMCGQKPWIHSWLKKHIPKVKKFFKEGPTQRKWQSNAYVALFIYAQLARDFGWDAYKKVFAEYKSLKKSERPRGSSQKIAQWITRFSKTVENNLCPLFAFWGFSIDEGTKTALESLPGHLPKDEITDIAPERASDICKEYNICGGPLEFSH